MPARELWQRLETLHAVTYFSPESRLAAKDAGLKGFWMGYFGFRAAPMGAVSPATVAAAFANFAPAMIERALPDAWTIARPGTLTTARCAAAAAALRRSVDDIEDLAVVVNEALVRIVAAGDPIGRPLFAANSALETPSDPVEALWQLATCIREYRGDGHVQLLAVAGLDGIEAHQLHAAEHGTPSSVLQESRGWSDDEWQAATDRLIDRGLLTESGELTEDGRSLRQRIEADTDALAARPMERALSSREQEALVDALTPAATTISTSGELPYPNPMGLPPIVVPPAP